MTVLIPSVKNIVNILVLELHKTRIIKTLVEKIVDNKTFSSQPRSAEKQPAKKKSEHRSLLHVPADRAKNKEALCTQGDF